MNTIDEKIIHEYVVNRRSARAISQDVGIGKTAIQKRLKKLGLSRSKHEAGLLDIAGRRFGSLIAIRRARFDDHGSSVWECRCDCGVIKPCGIALLMRGNVTSCGCRKYQITSEKLWRGHGAISGGFWSHMKGGAAKRGIAFEITIEYAWQLYLAQRGRCALTGRPIDLTPGEKHRNRTASIDRIDSSFGYVPDNIQWVHKHVNLMKRSLGQQEFIDVCSAVVRHTGGKA